MKCRSCQAESEADAVSCWACGVRLQRPPDGQRPLAMRPDAMRHYSTASAAIATHQPWLDGLVLISTILFGLLLGSFVVGVLPASGSPGGLTASLRRLANPLALLTPLPQVLPLEAAGVAQASRGFVAQIVQPYRSPAEGGITAGPGTE
ncbi:MAG: hypothetical protein ACRDI2_14430, partial [Chloroflexota bacterium]